MRPLYKSTQFLFYDLTGHSRPEAALLWTTKNWSHAKYCRLGWVYSRVCWVSLHSTQPTYLPAFLQN